MANYSISPESPVHRVFPFSPSPSPPPQRRLSDRSVTSNRRRNSHRFIPSLFVVINDLVTLVHNFRKHSRMIRCKCITCLCRINQFSKTANFRLFVICDVSLLYRRRRRRSLHRIICNRGTRCDSDR